MGLIIAPAIAAAIGVSAATASIIAEVIVIAVGLGISLISQLLFKPAQPKPSDVQTIIKQAAAPRTRSYGRVKVGGILMFANTRGGVLDRVIAMGSGEIDAVEEHWIDDHQVTLSGNAVSSPGQYVGKCIIEYRTGTDSPAPYSGLMAAWPAYWTGAHLGRGIPSAWMEMFQVKSEDMGNTWPQYASTLYRQVQRAAKVPNVFGGALTAPEWSDNSARCILDYLIHPDGLGLDPSWITNADTDWGAAIAICEEPVALAAGGTEPRYRLSTTYGFAERPADVLGRMLQTCDAILYPTPNRGLALKVGKWIEPTITIDDDAIIAFSEFGRGRDILTTANTIRARYTSPDHDYLETDADPWIDEADVAERGEYAVDVDMLAVPSHAQARRLMKLAAARSNPQWVGKLTCNLRALPVMGERFVNVVISELGIDQTFEVLNVQLLIETTVLTGVMIDIASLSADAYDWNPVVRSGSGEEGTPPAIPPIIVGDSDIPVPTGLALTQEGVMVRVSWAAPPDDLLDVEIRYKQVAAADWLIQPVADGALSVNVGPLQAGADYQFEARHRSGTTTRVSAWVTAGVGTISIPADAEEAGIAAIAPGSGSLVVMAPNERALYITSPDLAALTIALPDISGVTGLVITTLDGNTVTTSSGSPLGLLPDTGAEDERVEICFSHPVEALTVTDAAGVPVPDGPTNAYGPGAALFFYWVDDLPGWVYWK